MEGGRSNIARGMDMVLLAVVYVSNMSSAVSRVRCEGRLNDLDCETFEANG